MACVSEDLGSVCCASQLSNEYNNQIQIIIIIIIYKITCTLVMKKNKDYRSLKLLVVQAVVSILQNIDRVRIVAVRPILQPNTRKITTKNSISDQ
jgi:uncharacterized membrane protein